MFENPSAERMAIEMTYEDTATIYRTVPQTGVDGLTQAVLAEVYQGIVCGLSRTGGESSGQTKAQNNVDYDAVIFAAPELQVLPGDRVSLQRFGRDNPDSRHILHFAVVGCPAVYATHQEVRVKDGDLA
ncbi:MAG: hypothetical protein ACLU9S_07105 [Oscillospiraceae bacterium]|jgi:hypothetical protein|nr:MAG TPA: head closure knob [Caudoviricetes sp.]